ncbi:hypothetical protein [Ferrimonas balearica]|uniref:hypothetical protein n=1 Tax=Ferrimonas balearica TaxID=44012 RepID=UPI001C997DE5|nr:hypothetical protein [Ferrimonas balearica]MBY5992511.1 hypothetical protein [Ferrimonas balearica]
MSEQKKAVAIRDFWMNGAPVKAGAELDSVQGLRNGFHYKHDVVVPKVTTRRKKKAD